MTEPQARIILVAKAQPNKPIVPHSDIKLFVEIDGKRTALEPNSIRFKLGAGEKAELQIELDPHEVEIEMDAIMVDRFESQTARRVSLLCKSEPNKDGEYYGIHSAADVVHLRTTPEDEDRVIESLVFNCTADMAHVPILVAKTIRKAQRKP